MDVSPVHTIAADALRSLITDIFAAAGCADDEAARIGLRLVNANLAGHDSHGVIRTPRYVEWLGNGFVRAGQSISVVVESATHAVVDGHRGFGQTVAEQAVDLGIGKARTAGMAIVGLRNAGHIGRVGDWGERAAAAGLVSIHFVNVAKGQIVAPFGGVDRRFGTNPVCIAIPPLGDEPPLLLDFATSLVAEGKVLVASNGGKPVPPHALIDADGEMSGDPAVLYGPLASGARDPGNGTGALRAFGEHKGSGLAFMCEILAGAFTGGGTARVDDKRAGITNGMLSIYLDPAHFAASGFVAEARSFADYVKASRPAASDAEVLVPGETEARTRAARLAGGVPLPVDVWRTIAATAGRLGLTPPG